MWFGKRRNPKPAKRTPIRNEDILFALAARCEREGTRLVVENGHISITSKPDSDGVADEVVITKF